MNIKHYCIVILFTIFSIGASAQLGIKAGINMANETKSFSNNDVSAGYKSENLTGYQMGFVYQILHKKSGFGFETGASISQKGSFFSFDSTTVGNSVREGYKEINYLEVPLNLRYKLSLGFIGVYGFGGLYGGYVLSSKTVDEILDVTVVGKYSGFTSRIDFGYNFGAGLELLKKIQLGATWSKGLKNTSNFNQPEDMTVPFKSTNGVYSINLVYLF